MASIYGTPRPAWSRPSLTANRPGLEASSEAVGSGTSTIPSMRIACLLLVALTLAIGGAPIAVPIGSMHEAAGCCGDTCRCGETCPCGIERNPAPDRPSAIPALLAAGTERLATPPRERGLEEVDSDRPANDCRRTCPIPTGTSGRRLLLMKSVWRT